MTILTGTNTVDTGAFAGAALGLSGATDSTALAHGEGEWITGGEVNVGGGDLHILNGFLGLSGCHDNDGNKEEEGDLGGEHFDWLCGCGAGELMMWVSWR